MKSEPTPNPSGGRFVRTLKDGYWDRTEVIELADGAQRVRKCNKGAAAPGPWGVESLRREIRYLTTLPPGAAAVFPPVLACWDRTAAGAPDIGYEMPFYAHHTDAGALAQRGALDQAEIDVFQHELAGAVLERLHKPAVPDEPLSRHLVTAIRQGLDGLAVDASLGRLIGANVIEVNRQPAVGPRAALERIIRETDALAALDAAPSVRLHGDFFLENILWRSAAAAGDVPRLILIDPVSVAGVSHGPPLFDLVKYESYATGELLALRSERVEVTGFDSPDGRYQGRIRWDDPLLAPFKARDWHGVFRRAFVAQHGPVNGRLHRLIDGYFSVAMALNTGGIQRPARLLKATADLNAVLV